MDMGMLACETDIDASMEVELPFFFFLMALEWQLVLCLSCPRPPERRDDTISSLLP